MRSLVLVFLVLSGLMSMAGIKSGSVSAVTDEDRFTVVSYELVGAPAVITFDLATNGVSVGPQIVSTARGDVWRRMEAGVHSFKLRADRVLPDGVFEAGAFSINVVAWPVNDPPDYMVVDLVTNATVAVPQVFYYPSVDHLPNGGLANRNYAVSKLVMRKIPAANVRWQMGNVADKNNHDVILSENYYIGIYEVTGTQESLMLGNAVTSADPKPNVRGYNGWRGNEWPTDGHDGVGGVIARYRAFTGLELDLPTEAQWEFAARAGEYRHTLYTGTNVVADANGLAPMLDEIAWYGYNSQNASGKCERKEVGLLKPNAFGLYDMLGNVAEYCLDFWRGLPNPSTVEIDPVGGSSGNRILRGGTYNHVASRCSLVSRLGLNPDWWDDGENGVDGVKTSVQGARLVCPAIAVR